MSKKTVLKAEQVEKILFNLLDLNPEEKVDDSIVNMVNAAKQIVEKSFGELEVHLLDTVNEGKTSPVEGDFIPS